MRAFHCSGMSLGSSCSLQQLLAARSPGLGMGDVATMRQILRKCGITSIVVTPEGPGAWRFEGQADFSGVLHRRSSAPPPDTPPGQGSDPPAPGRASAEAEEDLDKRGAASVASTVGSMDSGVLVDIGKDGVILGFEIFAPSRLLPTLTNA